MLKKILQSLALSKNTGFVWVLDKKNDSVSNFLDFFFMSRYIFPIK